MNEHQIGEPCATCGVPMIMGKTGKVYCKPCYIAWANKNKPQNQPSVDMSQFLTVTQANETLDRQRKAFSEMANQIKELSARLEVAEQALDNVSKKQVTKPTLSESEQAMCQALGIK